MDSRHVWQWRMKPPVGTVPDRGHPLMRGLGGFWRFVEGGGLRSQDQIAGRHAEFTGATWAVGRRGRLVNVGPIASTLYGQVTAAGALIPTSGAFSILVEYAATEAPVGRILTTVNDGDSVGIERPWGLHQSGGTFDWVFRDSADVDRGVNSGVAPVLNTRYQVVAVVTDGGVSTLYVTTYGVGLAPVTQAYAGGTAATRAASATTIQIGRWNNTYGQYSGGHFERLMVWPGRALARSEVESLAADPYQMFAPPVWRRYVVPFVPPPPPVDPQMWLTRPNQYLR